MNNRFIYVSLIMLAIVAVCAIMAYVFYDPALGHTKSDLCGHNQHCIARALSQYEEVHGHYPPPYTVNADGLPLHSWRVLLLPYLEQQELYDQIRLDEPWNSDYNAQFHHKDLPIFHCPAKKPARVGSCDYAVLTGKNTPFPLPESNTPIVSSDHKTNILIVESAEPISCWMKPQDIHIELNEKNIIDKIGFWHDKNTIVTLTDSAVLRINPDEFERLFLTGFVEALR